MITHVAVRFGGKIHSLPAPNRHHHVLWKIAEDPSVKRIDAHGEDQGFLDDAGNYLTRVQALLHANECGQVKEPGGPEARSTHPELYSEDVW